MSDLLPFSPEKKILWKAVCCLKPSSITFVLSQVGRHLQFESYRYGKYLGAKLCPHNLSSSDLPVWVAAVIRSKLKGVNKTRLDAYEENLRLLFVDKKPLLTICLGHKNDFHRSCLFHISRDTLAINRNGATITVTAPTVGERFVRDAALLHWTFSFWLTSAAQAEKLERRLINPKVSLISFEGAITGLIAANVERWETIGLDPEAVRRLGLKRGVRLNAMTKLGCPSRAFRVKKLHRPAAKTN